MIIEDDGNRSKESTQKNQKTENTSEDNTLKLEMGGSKVHSTKIGCNTSIHILDTNPKAPCVVEKTISLRNFVREKSIIAVSIMLRHLSEKRYKGVVGNSSNVGKDASYSSKDNEMKEVYEKTMEKTT